MNRSALRRASHSFFATVFALACFAEDPHAHYTAIPLQFERNLGQASGDVEFLARTRAAGILVHSDGVSLVRNVGPSTHRLRMQFAGANAAPVSVGRGRQGDSHYMLGKTSPQTLDIPTYRRVEYANIYPGIAVTYYGTQGLLEYDFAIHPGSNPGAIRLTFQGADAISITPDGELVIATSFGEVRHRRPALYQEVSGRRHVVEGGYILAAPDQVRFRVGSYDTHSTPLVIDPILSSSTYLGGSSFDQANGVAVDSAGYIYIVGETWSPDFPAGSSSTKSSGLNSDAFVVKLNPSGTAVIFTSFLSGSNRDVGTGIALDAHGNIYVVGFTYSPDFPTTSDALRRYPVGQEDVFVAKLSSSNGKLSYSTYLGGQGSDFGMAIAVDSWGYVYVAGYTSSLDFPVTANSVQSTFKGGFYDGFVSKLNLTQSQLVYSTFLGGTGTDIATGIAVDGSGLAYVTGSTISSDFPLQNNLRTYAGNGDAFVAQVDSNGSHLIFSTYVGGSGTDNGNAIAVDSSGIYVAGNTSSIDFGATAGAFQTVLRGSYDAFVAKISNGAVLYCTYLGGSSSDSASGMAVDTAGNVYLSGYTYSVDFPLASGLQTYGGQQDAFVAVLDRELSKLRWSSYLGGAGSDDATAVAVDSGGNISVTGMTTSSDFDVQSGAARRSGMDASAFLVRVTGIALQDSLTAVSVSPSSGTGMSQTFTFQFSHPGGYGMIAAAALRITGSDYQDCTLYYSLPSLVQMLNDNDSVWSSPVQVGSGSGLQNSRCTINTAETWVTGSGTMLTLSVPVTFQPVFSGTRTVSVQLTAANGLYTGFQQLGSWTIPSANVAPSAVSVSPSFGSGMSQTFTFEFSHPGGYGMIAAAALRITGSDYQDCTLYYSFPSLVQMLNDNDSVWSSPVQVGSGSGLQNSRCTINTGGTWVTGSGAMLTLSVPVTFQPVFSGTRTVSVQLTAANGLYTGFQQLGSWTIPSANVAPSAGSVSPSFGSGMSQTFTFEFSHPGGYGMIAAAALRITGTDSQDCTLYYSFPSLVRMLNDNDSVWSSPVQVGSGSGLQNSRCTINTGGTWVTGSGAMLTLSVPVTFQPVFSGTRTVSVQLTAANGLYTGFQQLGSWTIPSANVAPSAGSVSPSFGSGMSQTFTFEFSHPGGYGMIAAAALRITGTDSQDCTLYYSFPSLVRMLNDNDSVWSSPVQVGSGSGLQNSRCTINTGGTWVTGSGTMLTLSVPVTFQPVFSGTRTVSVQLTAANGLYTGFQQLGSWIVP